jgi:hypothetical protein
VPAAVALRVRADGAQSYEPVAVFDVELRLSVNGKLANVVQLNFK